eukprot:15365070-Ditylum_brightwellii.AAC.2
MDLTISITSESKLLTTLFKKHLNMYLYIPSHSAHPPRIFTGMVHGQFCCMISLCSDPTDRKLKVNLFFHCLLHCGYKCNKLLPIFEKAIFYYQNSPFPNIPTLAPHYINDLLIPWKQMYLHMQFHPQNNPSYMFQQVWRKIMGCPPHGRRLSSYRNKQEVRVNIDRMVVAYSCLHNLGNNVLYWNLEVQFDTPT